MSPQRRARLVSVRSRFGRRIVRLPSVCAAALLVAGIVGGQDLPDYSDRLFAYPGPTDSVAITWDDFGVPEIVANTDAGALYGWGYAMSVDRFFQMEMARRELKGKQAELLGENVEIGEDVLLFSRDPVESDRDVRRLRIPQYLSEMHDALAVGKPAHFALLQAFSDGVNQFLVEKLGPINTWTAGNLLFPTKLEDVHPLFEKFPLKGNRFQPWTPLDCLAALGHVIDGHETNVFGPLQLLYAYRFLTLTVGQGRDAYADFHDGEPPDPPMTHEEAVVELLGVNRYDEQAMAVKRLDVPALEAAVDAYAQSHGWGGGTSAVHSMSSPPDVPPPTFSHGIAAGGSRIAQSDHAVVLAMPQLPVTKMLFECSVKGATFSARGVSFPGCPGFMVGFNADVGWGITSAGGTGQLLYELHTGTDSSGELDLDTYWFGSLPVVHELSVSMQTFPVRSSQGALSWTNKTVEVRWADAIQHVPGHPDKQVTQGLPVVTKWLESRGLEPLDQFQYAILHPRYFDHEVNTVVAYLDMLGAEDVHDIDDTVTVNYTNPACSMYAGDKDGNVGYWHLNQFLLHSPDPALAPLGALGAMRLNGPQDLAQDIIPMDLMPHVVNPLHTMVVGVRSPMEHIVVCGNSSSVGAWYPLPIYAGFGDTLRSMRFWQLLGAYSSDGVGPGSPDAQFTAEEILGFHYDDVEPFNYTFARAAMHQRDNGHDDFLDIVGEGDVQVAEQLFLLLDWNEWLEGGGHMHSVHPHVGALTMMNEGIRSGDNNDMYVDLINEFGQAQSAKCLLVKALENAFASNPSDPGDILTRIAGAGTPLREQMRLFLGRNAGNAYSRAVFGHGLNDDDETMEPLGYPPALWRAAFHSRHFNRLENGSEGPPTTGARMRVRYHDDLLGYGSLDPQYDFDSGILHNPRQGVGGQASNFHAQWVHFRWVGDPARHAWAVFNVGNSLHPGSEFFDSNLDDWERDNLYFDLEDTQQEEPTRYFREAPLQ